MFCLRPFVSCNKHFSGFTGRLFLPPAARQHLLRLPNIRERGEQQQQQRQSNDVVFANINLRMISAKNYERKAGVNRERLDCSSAGEFHRKKLELTKSKRKNSELTLSSTLLSDRSCITLPVFQVRNWGLYDSFVHGNTM